MEQRPTSRAGFALDITLKLMQLRTPTFSVELDALRRVDNEDWARVRVDVQAGGFAAINYRRL